MKIKYLTVNFLYEVRFGIQIQYPMCVSSRKLEKSRGIFPPSGYLPMFLSGYALDGFGC
jgi:hypothetical protein